MGPVERPEVRYSPGGVPANDVRLTPDLGRVRGARWRVVDAATRFRSPKTHGLFRWWQGAGGGRPPRRRSFDVTRHAAIIADLYLVRVAEDGSFTFQLQGECVRDLLGPIGTRQRIGPAAEEPSDRDLFDYYRGITVDRRCRLCSGALGPRGRDIVTIESLDCPLTDDGGRVSAILGLLVAV